MGARNLKQQKLDHTVFRLQKSRICHQHIFGRGKFSKWKQTVCFHNNPQRYLLEQDPRDCPLQRHRSVKA